MGKITYIIFGEYSEELKEMIDFSSRVDDEIINFRSGDNLEFYSKINDKVIFAMDLNLIGVNAAALDFLETITNNSSSEEFKYIVAAIFVRSTSELYTKSFSRKFIMLCNKVGVSFIGHSVVEATGSLDNYLTWQKTIQKSTKEISLDMCLKQSERLRDYSDIIYDNPKILVLHASSHENSNTMLLWLKIKDQLLNELSSKFINETANKKQLVEEFDIDIDELHVEDGTVLDCNGCDYVTCMHHAKTRSCFYGGPMVKEILPKVEMADIIILLAPNYNDSISAKLMAVVNRLTVLYRIMSFNNKKVYGVIVSGNSGSDCVAMQIIDALNINKGFHLPPNFSIMETANDPLAILKVENLENNIENFVNCFIKDNFN